jgi:sterol desaturase/sphingolipid hydroxylase (fatty acid hydroxylase superfamily)
VSPDTPLFFQALHYLAFNVTKAVTALVQRESVIYWPFVLSALVIAVAVAYASRRSKPETSFTASLRGGLSRDLWWHPSARADYRLYFVNALVLPALFGVVLFGEKHVASWLDALIGGAPVLLSASDPSIASRVAFTLAFFVAYDFGRFVAHSLLHDIPVLWEFHKVHHSAEMLNPMTAFRAHPVDLAVMAWVPALTTGIATWAFNRVAEVPVSVYSFLGLHVLIFAFNLIGILRHSHVWLHYGPSWGKWLISPAHHQLHHSCEPEHIGANRGFELAIWDRLYGTLFVPGAKKAFRMGLGDGSEAEWHNVRRMYLQPFVAARRRLKEWPRAQGGRSARGGAEAATDAEPKQRPG